MLILRRREGESIQVFNAELLEISVLEIEGNVVKLGFSGDGRVMRSEVLALQVSDAPPPAMPLHADDLEELVA
jgi:sRNA-binding carbon storage regulator CsrA